MPIYKFTNASNRQVEEAGDYEVTFESFEFKVASSGNDYLEARLRTPNGVLIYDNLTFTPKSFWKFDTLLKCFMASKGLALPPLNQDFEIDAHFVQNALVGATGKVALGVEKTPKGQDRNNVLTYHEARQAAGNSARSAPAASGGRAVETPEKGPF